MKLSQSFVVVSLSVAAHSQVGLSAPIPNSPEPNLLSPRNLGPSRLGGGHQIRSPRPDSNSNDDSRVAHNPMHDLFSRSSASGSERGRPLGSGQLLDLDPNLKKRENVRVTTFEKRAIDGALTPLGVTSIDDTVKALPVLGETLSSAVVEPIEKALDPTIKTLANTIETTVQPLPLVGSALSDTLKSTHLDQRSLSDTVKPLPVVGPIVAGLLTTVDQTLQPVVDTVLTTAHGLPVVGGLIPSDLPLLNSILKKRDEYDYKPLSRTAAIKKRENPFAPFVVEAGLLNQAGGAFPIEPSKSLDHLTLPNQITTFDEPTFSPDVILSDKIIPSSKQSILSFATENIPHSRRDERAFRGYGLIERNPLPTIREETDSEPTQVNGPEPPQEEEYQPKASSKFNQRSELQKLFKRRFSFINQSNNNLNRSLNLKKLIKQTFK